MKENKKQTKSESKLLSFEAFEHLLHENDDQFIMPMHKSFIPKFETPPYKNIYMILKKVSRITLREFSESLMQPFTKKDTEIFNSVIAFIDIPQPYEGEFSSEKDIQWLLENRKGISQKDHPFQDMIAHFASYGLHVIIDYEYFRVLRELQKID